MSGAPARSSASSARRRCARRSISPRRRGGLEIAMLSATERSGTATAPERCEQCRRGYCRYESKATSPVSTMRLTSGATTPDRILINVDLPGVLAENAVNATREHREIRVREGAHAAVALGYALHPQNRQGRRLQSRHAAKPRRKRNPRGRARQPRARRPRNITVPRRPRVRSGYLFSFDCPMISAALKFMLQVGKELPTKKLSPSLE